MFSATMGDISNGIRSIKEAKSDIEEVIPVLDNIGSIPNRINITNSISSNLTSFATSLTTFAEKTTTFITKMKKISKGDIDSAAATFEDLMSSIKSTVSSGDVSSITQQFSSLGSSGGASFASGISSKSSSAKSAAASIASSAASSASTKYSTFYSAGRYLMEGLINGMNSKKTDAGNVAKNIGEHIADKFDEGAGVNSPSYKTYATGRYCMLGLINAFADYSDAVYDSGREAGIGAINGLRDALTGQSDNGLYDYDDTITIRPVMDLSEIQNGMSEIDSMAKNLDGYSISGSMGYGLAALNSMSRNGQRDSQEDLDKITKAIDKLGEKLDRPTQTNNFTFNGVTEDEFIKKVKKSLTNDVIREGRKWA
jgi:hypothetical protein